MHLHVRPTRGGLCERLVLLAAIIAPPALADTTSPHTKYRILQSFAEPAGGYPEAPLVAGADRFLYGSLSGDFSQADRGQVFRVAADGTTSVVHAFAADGSEGAWPAGPLAVGVDGSFYGVAGGGGAGNDGVIYHLTTDGTLTVLHSFSFTADDYIGPVGGLTAGPDGNFYGELSSWGFNAPIHSGAIYRITPAGDITILHVFDPVGELGLQAAPTFGSDGRLYGTTEFAGDGPCGSGCGTLWAVAMDGTFEVVHTFSGGDDGMNPMGGLLRTSRGEIYGTVFRGALEGGGVFRLSRKGVFETVFEFAPEDAVNGSNPSAGLAEDGDGLVVGSTVFGGAYQHGTLFKLSRKGVIRVLHSFGAESDDSLAVLDAVSVLPDGSIRGVSNQGGATGAGTLFQFKGK